MPFRNFSQAEQILTERRRMDRPLFITVWVGAASFALAEQGLFYFTLVTLAVAINILAVRRATEVHVDRIFVNLGVVASTGILAVELLVKGVLPVQAIGHFLLLLQFCKLFEKKTNRDYTQILALSALTVVAAAMFDNSPLFAGLVIVYLVLLFHTAMVFTLKRGLDRVAQTQLATDVAPTQVRQIAWNVIRAWPTRPLRQQIAFLLFLSLLCGAIAFFALPRLRLSSGIGLPSQSGQASAGFTDRVTLGDTQTSVYQSNNVVMSVRLHNKRGLILALGNTAYLRGETFNRYQNSQWSNLREPARKPLELKLPPDSDANILYQDISLDSSLLPTLFSIYPPISVTAESGQALFSGDLNLSLSGNPGGKHRERYSVMTLGPPLSEKAKAYLARIRQELESPWPANPADTVDVPDSVRELAQQWCQDLLEERKNAPPEQQEQWSLRIAERLAQNLRQNYEYTLDLSDTNPSRDGVEDFLFYTQKGHCEYFASALTTMCRVLDIRARLVTGFLLSEFDWGQERYIVRGRDAHAWTEVFTPQTDWVIIDATPPGGRNLHREVWGESIRQFWAEMQFWWYEKVISYNADSRYKLWETVRNKLSDLRHVGFTRLISILASPHLDGFLLRMAAAFIVFVVCVLIVLLYRVGNRLNYRRAQERRNLPIPRSQVRFVRDMVDLLEAQGYRRPREQTLREYVSLASLKLSLPVEETLGLIDLYYRIRWGRQIPTEQQLIQARQRVERLRQQVKEARQLQNR